MSEADFTHHAAGTRANAWRSHERWEQMPEPQVPRGTSRLLVVAAHPDDETLGAGALLRHAARSGWGVDVVVATLGEASHPYSPTHTPLALAQRRREEVSGAVSALAPGAGLHLLGLPDGRLAEHEPELAEVLATLVAPGTLVVAPWTGDGHPDHAAAGRAAAHAAGDVATCWFYPIWFWHWGEPAAAPWEHLTRRRVSADERAARRRAAAHHASQTTPLSAAPGDETLLTAELLEHFADDEVFVIGAPERHPGEEFEGLHAGDDDPWGTRSRWYETRKRALTLAALPRERYARGLEIGCSVGTLTAELAGRCDSLVAMDGAQAAVDAAREALADATHVQVRHGAAPADLPEGPFDLVVISEVGYFLLPLELAETARRIRTALAEDGDLVLCHWRHEIEGWPLDGPEAHTMFARLTGLERLAWYEDPDVLLEVYGAPGRVSVAAEEGLL